MEYFMPISELSKKLDLPAHTLRYWEREFPTLIAPTTGTGGRRFYRPETVNAIMILKRYLYSDGYTIDGVKKLISKGAFHLVSDPQESGGNIGSAPKSAPQQPPGQLPINPLPSNAATSSAARQSVSNIDLDSADRFGIDAALSLLRDARALLSA